MKKSIVLVFALILSCNLFAQSFDSSKIRAGAGLVYASEIGNIGITLNGVYSFTDKWEGAFGYSHIFEKDYVSYNIFDFDAHYVFHQQDDKMNFYGIGGLNITSVKVDIPDLGFGIGGSASDSSVGINLGVGMNYKLSDKLNLAPEARFTIVEDTYFRIGASLQYMF
ncbi:outer membrane beta-barrel protein [Carboxylicivirga sediminis]|uniref:Outer membrane beta-barrel protein n=1 Tax=Carboxylicivirga sediminis TaxID=2006564 RepID=A0A941F918_9BACT|nr:outer membrane beta-barrel protein [Carboxylicivirga sediminis]MBR8537818.1 outer membrane beta-barrel protein [Carboxylicivirga sediminis]